MTEEAFKEAIRILAERVTELERRQSGMEQTYYDVLERLEILEGPLPRNAPRPIA